MHAAVVEFDSLSDPVRPSTENNDLLLLAPPGLVFIPVGRVVVGRVRLELRGAGVDQPVGRQDAHPLALLPHGVLRLAPGPRNLPVRKAQALGLAQIEVCQDAPFVRNFLQVHQEPAVNLGRLEDLFDAPVVLEGHLHPVDAFAVGHQELALDRLTIGFPRIFPVIAQSKAPRLERTERLLHALLEGPPDTHGLPHRFHLGGQDRIGGREFLKGKAGHLGHHVVDGRLEAGRRLPGDVVGQFVQGVAHRQLGRDLGDREAGRLGRQGRRARDPRVHFDHHHPPVFGIHRELDVRSTGFHPDLPDHGEGLVAHDLVLAIGEGLGGRHRDGVAGVHPHRVEVLDRADDHAVVRPVAHDLHLELLPAEQALLDEDLRDGREIQSPRHDGFKFFPVVGDAPPAAAQGVGRPDDEGKGTDLPRNHAGILHGVHHP